MTSRRLLSPTTKLLLDAADYMEKHGHCKGALSDDEGRVCLTGAIHSVWNAGELELDVFSAAFDRVQLYLKSAMAPWNDRPERTQEEVVSALRAAALEETPAGEK